MTKLTSILGQTQADELRNAWNSTEAASESGPLPRGEYIAHIIQGEPTTSRANETPGYKLTFQVIEGDHQGRRFWETVWITPLAMPRAKRDLGKLGFSDFDQLDQPLPRGIRCRVQLGLRREDDGTEFNRVRRFDVIGIDEPERDPFAPEEVKTQDDPSKVTVEVTEDHTEGGQQ